MEDLKDIYHDPSKEGSFGGVDSLYKAARKQGIEISKTQVRNWLAANLSYTLHKPARKKFKRNRTIVFYKDELWQMDLCDMRQLSEFNDNNKHMLTVIDVFSKMGFARPLKDKRGVTVFNAFKDIVSMSGRKPVKLSSDLGSEFLNKVFRDGVKSMEIKFYTTYSDMKASVVERFNRTIKNRMWRYFTHNNTYRYIDILPKLIVGYNSTPHSGIKGRTPISVDENNNLKVWRESHAVKHRCKVKYKFSVGDKVRISRDKGVFGKGYRANWSEEYFIVVDRVRRLPPVYRLQDLNENVLSGVFYEQQLQKISPNEIYPISKVLRKRKGRALVSWRGWPSPDFDSWIPLADIQAI